MKTPIIQFNTVRVLALVAGLSLAISAKATVPVSDLPDFDNLPNFAQLGNNLVNSSVTVNGNSGVSSGGTLGLAGPSTINGDLYVAPGASTSGLGTVTGSIFTGQDLSVEQSTVFSASSALAALTPDQVVSSLQTGSLSFDVPAGEVYVLNLDGGLNLSGGNTITLTGGGALVINVSTRLSVVSNAGIFGDPANVFINYTGTLGANMSTATINGQLFIPDTSATIANGTVNGGIFSGNSAVTLQNLQVLNAVPVPEPGIMALLSAGFVSTLLLARRRFCAMKNLV